MLLLLAFALVAGAGTALTPCVLPVLPAVLSAGALGGRRRPVGVALGLVVTFTITIVGVAKLVDGVGAGTGALRWVAVAVLLGFGLALAVPAVGARIEAPLSRLARFGPRSRGDGFWSGLAVGGALGFVCAPCAGPILAAVISVSASQGTSARLVAIALAYAVGLGSMLALFAYGGRRALARVRSAGHGPALQRGLGAVLVTTALVMALELDVRFETALSGHVPAFLVNPTRELERSRAIEGRLADLRGHPRFERAATPAPSRAAGSQLRDFGPAPEFSDTQRWFNTGGRPLTMASLRGRVVLIDFWTYTCINCLRTLPFVRGLDARYRREGLTVVGVHTPEFPFEANASNVAGAIGSNHLRYPVVQDNRYGTWNAWGNQYWPAKYLVDANGHVRYAHFGEGGEDETQAAIRQLLAQAGATRLGAGATARGDMPIAADATPETYLGAARAERFVMPPRLGLHRYRGPEGMLPLSHFALRGTWRTTEQGATAVGDATLQAKVRAARVYLVLSSAGGRRRPLQVSLDRMRPRTVHVRGQRLYELVSLPRAGTHDLRLRFAPGLTGYAFTFG